MKTIDISLPTDWASLSEKQLRYLYTLIGLEFSLTEIKTYCFFRWSDTHVNYPLENGYFVERNHESFLLTASQINDAIQALNWIDTFPETPVRFEKIKGHRALPADFMGVSLETYIICENLYQGYLTMRDDALLVQLAQVLYSCDETHWRKCDLISIFYWFTSLKQLFNRRFPNFLKTVDNSSTQNLLGSDIGTRLQEAMDAEIRALTKGDITKEKEVLAMDCWRALTELDAQAREYEEINRKYPT